MGGRWSKTDRTTWKNENLPNRHSILKQLWLVLSSRFQTYPHFAISRFGNCFQTWEMEKKQKKNLNRPEHKMTLEKMCESNCVLCVYSMSIVWVQVVTHRISVCRMCVCVYTVCVCVCFVTFPAHGCVYPCIQEPRWCPDTHIATRQNLTGPSQDGALIILCVLPSTHLSVNRMTLSSSVTSSRAALRRRTFWPPPGGVL